MNNRGKRSQEFLRQIMEPAYILARFRAKTSPLPNGCVKWLGKLTGRSAGRGEGYGRFEMHGRTVGAHRAAYELMRGPVPKGLVLDHLCRNTWCVNPEHLEAVTNWENIKRGTNPAARNARKVVCARGHVFVKRNGKRRCPKCPLENRRALVAKRGIIRRPHLPLEIREKIVQLATRGVNSAAIARELSLNPDTVRTMVRRWRKYGVANRLAVWV